MLRLCGAELGRSARRCPTAIRTTTCSMSGRRLADQIARRASRTASSGPTSANNLDNRRAHYETTGPEIWQETDGRVDGFICSVGTGGTLAGMSSFLR